MATHTTPLPSVALARFTPTPTPREKTENLEITPSGILGLFSITDSYSRVREALELEEQPLWLHPKGGRPRLNKRAQHSDKHQMALKLRSETRALLVSLNPDCRMADGRGAGSEVGDFLSDFRLLNKGAVEPIDGLKDKPGLHAIYWLMPRNSSDDESRFGLILEKELGPTSFADVAQIKKWGQADEETLRTEKVLGFVYLLDANI